MADTNGNGGKRLLRELLKEPRAVLVALAVLTGGGSAAYSGFSFLDSKGGSSGSTNRLERLRHLEVHRLSQVDRLARIEEQLNQLRAWVDRHEDGLAPLIQEMNARVDRLEVGLAELRGIHAR